MKKIILLNSFLFITVFCNAQTDTVKNLFNHPDLKRGFYKNYTEYLNNSPSITPAFTIKLLAKSKKDSSLVAAAYTLNDSTKTLPHIWGFCDGSNVFVGTRSSLFVRKFWKIQCLGKNPYFLFGHKDIYAIGPPLMALISAAATASMPPMYDILYINEKGKPKKPSMKNLKKLFSINPKLLKEFKSEKVINDEVKKRYLIKFNQEI